MLSRRELIGKAAVGAAAGALALGAARTAVASTRPLPTTPGDRPDNGDAPAPEGDAQASASSPPAEAVAPAAPPPWALVRPFVAGTVLAHGWRLGDLGPVEDGACVVTLENERGRARRVHFCRNDGDPQGLVYTRKVDFVVMNEGKGDLPTEEPLAQAVAELAHAVAANEATAPAELLAELLPHAERLRRFAAAEDALAGGKLR
jgi:hypothetical protein